MRTGSTESVENDALWRRMLTMSLPMLAENADTEPSSPEGDPWALIDRLTAENDALRQENRELSTMRTMAFRDPLTSLHNRRAFDERLAEECARVRRSQNYRFALILVDLDDFKEINDTQGHTTGDRALRAVARFMQASVREVDLCFRIGGDEFAVILPGTDAEGCRAVVRRFRTGAPFAGGLPARIGLSVGVAVCPPDRPVPEALLTDADEAMYRDKARHKARKARVHSA